jgi:deoxyribose-phosphate aldolase
LTISKEQLAGMIDHTLLKPTTTKKDIMRLCREAKKYRFAAVCVNPTYVSLAAKLLKNTDVKVCTVIGFPLGATTTEVKAFETENAIKNGAQEVDMVINIGMLKSGNYGFVKRDIEAVVKAAGDAITKVIIETCYLSDKEKVKACMLAKKAGADYVKSSTGFGSRGATIADVRLMRKIVGKKMGVKAAGGIRTFEDAVAMIKAGATRIGTSHAMSIMAEAKKII